MTDFQLGLIVIGALAVAGVLVYNRLQERSARRQAERSFDAAPRAEVLLDEPAERREPTLGPAFEPTSRRAPLDEQALPDARADYVIDLAVAGGAGCGSVLEDWGALEHRFAGRVLLAGAESGELRRLSPGDPGRCTRLQAGLQLVSRAGVVGDAELIEFRSQVESLAARIGATVAAPEMRPALDAARELDRICAEADIQVALHVAGVASTQTPELEAQPFQVSRRDDRLTLTLDVARTPDPVRGFRRMARSAQELAASLGGRLVDDNGNAVDERALGAIEVEVEAVRQTLRRQGVEPGSPLALRLFS